MSESRPNIKRSSRFDRATDESLEQARTLRKAMTMPEVKLWQLLRARRLGGFKFRRQHPIGPYAADFYCHESALVVELDGLSRAHRRDRDADRDRFMAERDLAVLRVSVSDFERDQDAVLRRILRAASEKKSQ